MPIGVGLRFNNRTLSKQSRRTLQATIIITQKNQKSDGSFETSQKIIQITKKSLKKQRRKRKLFTLKIITTIFNNITIGFLCQSKKRPKHGNAHF